MNNSSCIFQLTLVSPSAEGTIVPSIQRTGEAGQLSENVAVSDIGNHYLFSGHH